MCDINDPDSGDESSPEQKAGVISLCAHRRHAAIEAITRELIADLEAIHNRAIGVHNDIIDRAQVSVLTELCRTAGLFLDLIEDHLQAAVVTPAALYGDSGGTIFGKKPLQDRIAEAVDTAATTELLEQLNNTHPGVWEYEPRPEEPTDWIIPLAGPNHQERCEVAGVIARAGELTDHAGVYSGWSIDFGGERFIVFGYRLDRRREVSVRDLLSARSDRRDPAVWRNAELALLRAIIDPDDLHQRPPGGRYGGGIRRPASRNGLVLAIHRALWRHFAEPREGLTIHAHIAALVNEEEGRQAFIDEVRQLIDTTVLKAGGLREDARPIDIEEILRPFCADAKGRLMRHSGLDTHPVALLMVEDAIMEAMGLDGRRSIGDALRWAEDRDGDATARAIQLAWMTYRVEQNLMATYGYQPGQSGPDDEAPESLSFARQSAVLPNIRTLFDPRFMEHRLDDLELDGAERSRLRRGLEQGDQDLSSYRLADIGRGERQLKNLRGVGHRTCNAVRAAILELGTHWRWRRCGMDPRDLRWREKSRSSESDDGLIDSLDRLANLFDD